MRYIFPLIIALLTACASTQTPDPVEAVRSLNAVNDRYNQKVVEHDAEGLLSLYSDEPVWIEPGKPAIVSLDGPRALFEYVTANKGSVIHTIDHLFISDDATLAVMIGSVEAKIEKAGLDATGTYLFVLEPDDEDWEIAVDMWQQHGVK